MSRIIKFGLLLVTIIFLNELVTASEDLDGDLFKNFDFEANDGSITKGRKIIKTTFSKVVKKFGSKDISYAGGCVSRPNIPLNGNLSCSSNTGCRAACTSGYRFPKGERELAITCQNKHWRIQTADYDGVPHCEPTCLPECKNNGICISPNQCDCPENFSGPQCQFENKPCLNLPPLIANAQRKCSSKSCTITCLNRFAFPDGSSVANLVCKHGDWVTTRSDWISIPDCQPTCNPPCQNSGVCLSLNVCQCPKDLRGPQCQYRADACSSDKLGFNGGFQCTSHDTNTYSCSLTCPDNAPFEYTPASSYKCHYDTGVFEPQPIPQCKPPEGASLVSFNKFHQTSYYKSFNKSWSMQASGDLSYGGTKSSSMKFGYEGSAVLNGDVEGNDGFSIVSNGIHGLMPNENSGNELEMPKRIEKKPKSGVCFTWGGIHYKTFDGQIYSFESGCAYTLLKDTRDGLFTVTIQNNSSCTSKTSNKASCNRIIHIYIQGKEYTLSMNTMGEPKLRSSNKTLPIPTQLSQLRVEHAHAGKFVIVTLDAVGLTIKWDGESLIQVDASEALWNRTAGLCGNSNGERLDDFLQGKLSIAHLANGWRVDQIGEKCDEYSSMHEHACASDPELDKEAGEFCTKLLSDVRYKSCAELIDLEAFQSSCRWDYCSCLHSDKRRCTCDTMGVYVRQCAHKKLVNLSGWRDQSFCPTNCSAGKVYMSCAPRTQSTCGTEHLTNDLNVIDDKIDESNCEDGCFCAAGTLLHQGRCITIDQCPCKLRSKSFEPGATIAKDCNTCACEKGKWLCTDSKCSGRCSAVGDPHYTTFDGKRYDFMGDCSYYLVKGENFSIEADNAVCSSAISEMMGYTRSYNEAEPTCTRAVTIRLNNDVSIKLKQNRQILVNGEDVTRLPMLAGGRAKIRIVSSIFVAVALPNGMEVLWDGVSRVYVNAPAYLRGQTKGLCGTFTSSQKDDFLTPAGDVEQSIAAFANKWKTHDSCNDVKKESDHPCDLNPQKRTAAERYCSALRQKLFLNCHWHVDPEPFYKDCLYDMCACEANVETCLCPTLATYAKDCAQLGVVIPWRQEVKECRVHCPGEQEYQVCGNSCTRSCADISFNHDTCVEECVEGCNCPRGSTLDVNGECIPIGQCPCVYGEIEFLAGYKEIRPGNKGQELCTCAGGIWSCQLASTNDLQDYPAMSQLKTMCSATRHQELTTCEPTIPRTCGNMHQPTTQNPAICRPGCVCKLGYVLDTTSNECVEAKKCPCYHGGQSYAEGSTMQEECNTCKCDGGKWNCTDIICPGICTVWGDSHHKTFDDRYYDFQGVCDYVLAKGKLNDVEAFDVTIGNVACGTTGVTCSKSVTLSVGKDDQRESITLTRGKSLSDDLVKSFGRITIRRAGLFTFLDVPDLGLVIQWDEGTRVNVRLSPKWKTRTKGLCGDFNDDASDDFKTPSGGPAEASASLFADSWKMSEMCAEPADSSSIDTCTKHPERKLWATQKCRLMKSKIFEPCHSEIAPDEFIDRCIYDACACDDGGDCECLCTAIAAYAQECNARGVPIKWRTQKLCPMQCDETCSTYSPCISTCPRETCDNLATIGNSLHMCDQDTCVEGCQPKSCPDGNVYFNESHTECVPKATCKTLCKIIDGVSYYEGDRVQGDNCHSCYCSRGKVVCKGEPCSTLPMLVTTTTTVKPAPFVEMKEEKKKCISGWSKWFNRDMPKDGGFRSDIEEIPKVMEMLSDEGSAVCDKDKIIDIQCRAADTKVSYKELGINVECSIENGLLCIPPKRTKTTCPDFEISVLCSCEDKLNSTAQTIADVCMLNEPYQAKLENCYDYVQCSPGPSGNVWVVKTCGPDMMFNEKMQICDWPTNVGVVRPECNVGFNNAGASSSAHSHSHSEAINHFAGGDAAICNPGEYWSDCAIQCSRTCSYYHHILTQQGLCNPTVDCLPGCVPSNRIECTTNNQLWRDQLTCVDRSNCVCITSNGQPLTPGTIVKSSECKSCQCINNFYTCIDDCEKNDDGHQNFGGNDGSLDYTQINNTRKHEKSKIIVIPNTVTPPRDCPIDNYIWLIEKFPFDAIITASSYESSILTSESARLRRVGTINTWRPISNDDQQYIEIQLDKSKPIYGVIIGGNAFDDKFVTSYKVLFSEDGQVFSYVGGLEPKIFRGPIDAAVPVRQIFDIPFEAKIVRVNPLSWHKGIAMQVELVGCGDEGVLPTSPPLVFTTPIITEFEIKPVCDESMGYDNYVMSDQQITVSSSHTSPPNLRLSSKEIWRPQLDNPEQYVQFDFLEQRNLTGIETKGSNGIWTTAYKVYYSNDAKYWNPVINSNGVEKEFLANADDFGSKVNHFERPIAARLLRIVPTKWHKHIGLKVEVHGCFLPYPFIEQQNKVTPKPQTTSECNVCRGVMVKDTDTCKCAGSLWWDGQFCVNKSECPCVVGHMTYAVGASYETADCHQCLCTLGGNAVCHPKKCEVCIIPGDRPSLTELCTCLCKPCPTGQRLCSTSNVCIDEKKWCDGVQDCPDDEYGCEYVAKTDVVKENVIKVQCHTTCPPGFVMVPEIVQETNGLARGYGSYNFSMQKTESYKSSLTIKIKVPAPARSFQSRMGEDSDSMCPKIICKPEIIKSNYVEDQCERVICPEGFQPKYDQSKSLRKTNVCDNTCVPIPAKERVCKVVGRTFVTFDLLEYKYDICNHIMARDRDENKWYVVAEKVCKSNDLLSCENTLTISIDNHAIVLSPNMHTIVDGITYTSTEVKRLGDKNPWMKLSRVGDALRLESRKYPFWALLDSSGNVKVGVSEELAGHVDGMCGYLDGLAGNDQQTPEGQVAKGTQEFGDSWKILDSAECSLKTCPSETQQEAWKMCTQVRDASFDSCSGIVNREKFISRCLESTCSCLSSGISTSSQCRCSALSAFVTECLAAGNTSVDLANWRTMHDCPAVCDTPFVHKDCFRNKCELSCDNLQQLDPCPATQGLCVPGCFCPDGTVRNGDTCIPPSQCRDCVCDSLGNSKYVSFDRSNVVFDGNCTYLLSRDLVKDGAKHVYEVLVSNGGCKDAICTDAIIIVYKSHIIQIKKDAVSNEFSSFIDEQTIASYPYKTSWLVIELTPNHDVTLLIPAIQLEITAYKLNFAFMLRLPSHTFGGTMEGLCGNCNAEQSDDFKKPDEQLTSNMNDFGRSWLISNLPTWLNANEAHCTRMAKRKKSKEVCKNTSKDQCERLLQAGAFLRCHALIDPTPYYKACVDSICDAKDEACVNLEAYARMCSIAGVCLDWRKSDLCPYYCPEHLEYHACESGCRQSCDTISSNNNLQKCDANPIEGCFCPSNRVLHNNTCIDSRNCFVCDDQGHVDGDVWQLDKCTICSCNKKLASCQTISCPALETICDENSNAVLVAGTEMDCCPKYLCVPNPTIAPACVEMQQPECGFAQNLKISVDSNGCQKFICQCVPEDQCASYETEIALDNTPLELGYVKVTNTSGCCPRTTQVCKPETCPIATECQKYYRSVVKDVTDSHCCPTYECEAPKDMCFYHMDSSNELDSTDKIVAKKIGDTWNDGKCKTCTCEIKEYDNPTVKCFTKDCLRMFNHPDIYEYVLEEVLLDSQCCPNYERVGCKYEDKIYKVDEKWYPHLNDTCTTTVCTMDVNGVSKKTIIQDCNVACELGFEYEPPIDSSVTCCGECVPVACVVDGLLKSIDDVWYSDDFCVKSSCVKDNGTLHVHVTKETCDTKYPLDSSSYKIEKQKIPGQCCPNVVKTACLGEDGKYHEPGERWQSTNDSCVVEYCLEKDGDIEKKTDLKICNKECPKGWEYREPGVETCCGECKQVYCIDDEHEYLPGSIWYADDNCTSYTCIQKNDQLIITKSLPVCPELDCAPELVYDDGCCKKCNLTKLSSVKEQACVAEVFDFDETIGILEEKVASHGICKNLKPIEGLTECHGHCNSSTHFDKKTWDQVVDCKCCQPVDFRKINVELTCEDGKKIKKILTVPSICTCETCSSEKEELPAIVKPYSGVKSYLKKHYG